MKASELRIGNLILQHTYRNGKCNCIRSISAIKKEGGLSINIIEENRTMSKHPIEWFAPIPLTEEWLVKLNFKKVINEPRYKEWSNHGLLKESICIEFNDEGCYYTGGDGLYFSKNIQYVHQLQNLYFALTNEELTYNA